MRTSRFTDAQKTFILKQGAEGMPVAEWFLSLADVRERLEAWPNYHNEDRPHGLIGRKPPIALHNSGGAASLLR